MTIVGFVGSGDLEQDVVAQGAFDPMADRLRRPKISGRVVTHVAKDRG
jgi:hypothetical protein